MKIKHADTGKNAVYLLLILAVFIASGIIVIIKMRTSSLETYLSDDKILKVLIVIEEKGEPVSANVIAYYPETKRSAMFDIPLNTGLIIQSLNRTDGIGAVYTEKGIENFRKEIEKLTGISVPVYITCTLEKFSELTDILGGLSVFIPKPVDIDSEAMRVLLPSGSVSLDGDKMRDYFMYEDEFDGDGDAALRKQKIIISMLRSLNDNSPDIFSDEKFGVVQNNFASNLSGDDFKKLLEYLCKMDSERLVPQRVTGAVRYVEDKPLLFPFRDGQQLKEIIRQTIAVLVSEDSSALERIYALEILNGTNIQGLAKNTSEVYQSFGYDVVQVGNTDEPVQETVLIDRIGNLAVAKIVAQVIRCKNIQTAQVLADGEYGSETNVDFSIILGADFNGYYVIQKKN